MKPTQRNAARLIGLTPHPCWAACVTVVLLIGGCSQSHSDATPVPQTMSTAADTALPAWLSGSWVAVEGDRFSQEHWTAPRGDSMFGVNRTVRAGRTVAFEFLRIVATDEGVYYLASPGGQHPPTRFKLTSESDNSVVFENPEHDFPTRIAYERDGDTLRATIHGTQNGQASSSSWDWRRDRDPF